MITGASSGIGLPDRADDVHQGSFPEREAGDDDGNLLEPRDPHTIDGGWRPDRRPALRHAFASALRGAARGLAGRG